MESSTEVPVRLHVLAAFGHPEDELDGVVTESPSQSRSQWQPAGLGRAEPGPQLLDLPGAGEAATQQRQGERHRDPGDEDELQREHPVRWQPDGGEQTRADRDGQHHEDPVPVQGSEGATPAASRPPQPQGQHDRGRHHDGSTGHGLHQDAETQQVRAVGDHQQVVRRGLGGEQVERQLQHQAGDVAGGHDDARGTTRQPSGRVRVQHVHQGAQGDRGDHGADGHQPRHTGRLHAGHQDGQTDKDDQEAEPVARPPAPGQQPGRHVQPADQHVDHERPQQVRRGGGHQHDQDRAQQQGGDPELQQRQPERARRRGRPGRGDAHHSSVQAVVLTYDTGHHGVDGVRPGRRCRAPRRSRP